MHIGCGHLVVLAHLQRRWSSKGREGFGFLSPFRRACEAGFGAFEKMKHIFSIVPVESLKKSCQMLVLAASDAASDALCASGEWYLLGCTHRTHTQ